MRVLKVRRECTLSIWAQKVEKFLGFCNLETQENQNLYFQLKQLGISMPVSSKEAQTRENCQLHFHLNFNSNFSVQFYYSKSCPSLLESVCKNMLLTTFMASDSKSCNDPSPCSQGFPECHSNCSYRAATLVSAARDGSREGKQHQTPC